MSSGHPTDPSPSVAFVTGATGQDGSYLCERLLAEGCDIHAIHRPGDGPDLDKRPWSSRVTWHECDLVDSAALGALVREVAPNEIYNLAAISSVAQSWHEPVLTAQVTGLGALSLMDAALDVQEAQGRPVRMMQASSAEIFGSPLASPQDENTPIAPLSPYGAAKAFAHHLAAVYRVRGLHVATLVLYNHESPRRPSGFVTRKITSTAAAIARGEADELALGNLDAVRDWGWAPDYVDAMVRALRAPDADTFVVATGVAHSVRDFVAAAFTAAGIDDWERHVRVDPAFYRPADPATLVGDASKARALLGWKPTVGFEELVRTMVRADLAPQQ